MNRNLSPAQFQHLDLPDVGHSGRTVSLSLPAPAEGHTRLFRFTNGVARGSYSETPLTAYGYTMHYVDVPHEELSKHEVNESGRPYYRYSGSGIKTVNPFTHPGAKVKDYELGDFNMPNVIRTKRGK